MDAHWSDDPHALRVPWTESPFFEQLLASMDVDESTADLARRFRTEGFLVFPSAIEPELLDRVVAEHGRLFAPDARFELPEEFEKGFRSDPNRRQDAWVVSDPVRELACHPRVLAMLRFLYAREPFPFQTLNFRRGTEQTVHSDAIHFNSIPPRFMCGVWVALEDISEENGPLLYYPGSHRLPDVAPSTFGAWTDDFQVELGENYQRFESYVRGVTETEGLEPQRLTAPRGSALIWAANLLHGGCPIRDPQSTRMSQVSHYYFHGCTWYTPALSNVSLGEISLRHVYDVATGRLMEPHLDEVTSRPLRLGNGRVRLRREVGGAGVTWGRLRAWLDDRHARARQRRTTRALKRMGRLR